MAVFPGVGDGFGRYRIERILGRGGMGVVFEATDTALGRPVALKVLLPTFSDDEEFRSRFAHEASVLAQLDSLNTVQIYEHGEIDGCLYLVTQLVRDGDLHEYIRNHGTLPQDTALSVISQICNALRDAHAAGIVHRDIKPSNVLVRQTRTGLHAYLCDFGIAQGEDSQHTRTGSVIGSTLYMDPERHTGARADVRADVYSVGCLLYELLTGTPPFTGTDIQVAMAHLNTEIPTLADTTPSAATLNPILTRALAKNPNHRYRSVSALANDLDQIRTTPHDQLPVPVDPAVGIDAPAEVFNSAAAEDSARAALPQDDETILRTAAYQGTAGNTDETQVRRPATKVVPRASAWAETELKPRSGENPTDPAVAFTDGPSTFTGRDRWAIGSGLVAVALFVVAWFTLLRPGGARFGLQPMGFESLAWASVCLVVGTLVLVVTARPLGHGIPHHFQAFALSQVFVLIGAVPLLMFIDSNVDSWSLIPFTLALVAFRTLTILALSAGIFRLGCTPSWIAGLVAVTALTNLALHIVLSIQDIAYYQFGARPNRLIVPELLLAITLTIAAASVKVGGRSRSLPIGASAEDRDAAIRADKFVTALKFAPVRLLFGPLLLIMMVDTSLRIAIAIEEKDLSWYTVNPIGLGAICLLVFGISYAHLRWSRWLLLSGTGLSVVISLVRLDLTIAGLLVCLAPAILAIGLTWFLHRRAPGAPPPLRQPEDRP
ncbi:MAG: serine/threonine-protein kinase [Marmoricola sp.]